MSSGGDIKWFKSNFSSSVEKAIVGTPFSVDMLTAIACQETGYIWGRLRKKTNFSVDEILELCVGDTIDAKPDGKGGRKVFPKNKDELLAAPRGDEMFAIARQSLEALAAVPLKDFEGDAANTKKFCRGYGIFQYDLQFFKTRSGLFSRAPVEIFRELSGCCD